MKKKHRSNIGAPPSFFEAFIPHERPPMAPPPPAASIPQPGAPTASPWELLFGRPIPIGRPPAKPAAPPKPAGPPTWVRPSVDPGQFFDLKGMFEYVRSIRQSPNWKPPTSAPLLQVARPTKDAIQAAVEVGRFFKISDAEVARYGAQAWQYVIEPFVRELERALNLLKPAELLGSFKFDFGSDGAFALGYVEQ